MSGALWALRITAVSATVEVLYQGLTAGQILVQNQSALELHGGGAIVLHVLTGLTAIAAGLYRRATRGPWWPAVLSAVVFVATFVEALYGHAPTLYVHVPLALLLVIGITSVAVWSFTRSAAQ